MTAVISTNPDENALVVIGETLRPLLTNEMGSSVEVYDTSGDEGMGPPPHFHEWSETYFMLEGAIDLIVGDEPPRRITAGMAAHAPAGATHGYTVAVNGTRFLTILSEGNGHAFFRQMDEELSMPPNLDDLMRITARHGIHIAT